MKILEAVFGLSSGGAERVVIDLCNEFVRQGHEVVLLTMRDIDRYPELSFGVPFVSEKVRILQLKAKYPTPSALLRLRRIIREESPDVIHMNLNVLPFFFGFALKRSGIRFFHTLHNIAPAACGYPGQKLLNRWFYRTGHIIPITISKSCDDSFREFYGFPAAAQIDNGRVRPKPTAEEHGVAAEIERLKQNRDDIVFVQVGTVGPVKNQLTSVKIFEELRRKNRHAVLLLIGKKGQDAEYCTRVMECLPSNVHYLGERKNVADYLLHADYFLMPSRYEGLPISLLEAMACGCIPICTAVGGIPDVIVDRKNGYLVPAEDEAALLNCIEQRVSVPETIDKEIVMNTYLDKYDISVCAGKYLSLFDGRGGTGTA